jgi:uncharacterized protein (UPF0332 family)
VTVAFEWREYLTLARDIDSKTAPTCCDEARWRAAVSRAYYAAFCTARDYLIECGEISHLRRDEPKLHQEVPAKYTSSNDGRRKDVGRWLREMRTERNRCDYDESVPDLRDAARQALTKSKWALDKLAKIRAP